VESKLEKKTEVFFIFVGWAVGGEGKEGIVGEIARDCKASGLRPALVKEEGILHSLFLLGICLLMRGVVPILWVFE
jgi:hypothetical protein